MAAWYCGHDASTRNEVKQCKAQAELEWLSVNDKAISCVVMTGPVDCRVMASQPPPEANSISCITQGIHIILDEMFTYTPSPGIGDNVAMSTENTEYPM